jgi:PilZ domain
MSALRAPRSGMEAVMHPRRFARVRPTGRNADVAKLIVGPKEPVIDCKVVDYSPGGACLEVGARIKLPDRFELFFGGIKKRCRIVWNTGRRFGVAF